MLETLKTLIAGRRLTCDDPVFGRLTTNRLAVEPDDDATQLEWFAEALAVPAVRFTLIEQVVVHAGRKGPGDGHRRGFTAWLAGYQSFEPTLRKRLFENYLWHRAQLLDEARRDFGDEDLSRFSSWPPCNDDAEAFARPCFDVWWLDVFDGGRLEFLLTNDWDEEHNLRVSVIDGVFDDMWQE